MSYFSDPQMVARYAEGPVRQVPGFLALQQMTGLLLAERTPDEAQVLVLGAGGGLELQALAATHPRWRFCGVDPSAEMLVLATQTLGALAARVELHEGYIDSAPSGPFDAATCLLTLHFVPQDERRRTLAGASAIKAWCPLRRGPPQLSARRRRHGQMARPLCRLRRGLRHPRRAGGTGGCGHTGALAHPRSRAG